MLGPRHFFRHASADMLEAFFEKAGAPVVHHAPFTNPTAQVDWALEVANAATPVARHIYCGVMDDVRSLATDLGALCLRETVADRRPHRLGEFDALRSDYDRGIWTWVRERDAFEEARDRWFYQRRRPTGTWTNGFIIAPRAKLDTDLGDLRSALQAILDRFDAGLPGVAFERYELDERIDGSSATLLTIAYEGRLVSKPRIENGEEHVLTERVVHRLAVRIETGRMYVVSESRSAKLRSAVAEAVARVGLGLAELGAPLPAQRYNLQRLLDPTPFDWDKEHNIEAVCVPSLTVTTPRLGTTRQRTFTSPDFDDVRALVLADLRPADRATVRVVAGQLRVTFGPRPGRRRQRPVTIGFGAKGASMDLNNAEEDLLRARMFDRWEFHGAHQSERAR